jgi:isoquinoline 1-oxidoreductase alpha subunit
MRGGDERSNDSTPQWSRARHTPLLWVLRDDLGMTGTKYGCGIAQCGACSVLVDGRITRSCVTPIDSVAGKHITTIEAVERDPVGAAWCRPGRSTRCRNAAIASRAK